jgi:hypothetical protein
MYTVPFDLSVHIAMGYAGSRNQTIEKNSLTLVLHVSYYYYGQPALFEMVFANCCLVHE